MSKIHSARIFAWRLVMSSLRLVTRRSCQDLLSDTAVVGCILVLIAIAIRDILSFVFVHREILLVEILDSRFMVIRFEHFLNTSRKWPLNLPFRFGFYQLLSGRFGTLRIQI